MSITESVCPKCGATAGANHYCTNCGLHLDAQYELPSRVEWLRRRGQATDTSHRSPSSELGVAPAGNESVSEGEGGRNGIGAPAGTLGDAISGARLSSVAVFAGLALVIVGSIAPWATSPLSSVSGTEGDGKLTIGVAVIAGLVLLLGRGGRGWIAALSLILLGIGIFEAIHIHKHVAKVTLFGQQVDHVGWGVYALIAGAAIAFTASFREMTGERARPPSS
jgi:hypothetical protein